MPQRLSDRSGLVRLSTAGALTLAAGLGVSAQAGVVTANWLSAASGTWNVATNWSTNPNSPNNGTPVGETYHAVIDATGANYIVTLNSAVTVNQFTLNSANATVEHTAGIFSVLGGGATISAGTYRLNGGTVSGGTWTVAGGTFALGASNGSIFDGATLNGSFDFSGASARVRLRNGASFTGDQLLTGASSILAFEQTSTLAAGRDIVFDAANNVGKFVSVEGNHTLTIANGASIRGRTGTIRGGFFIGGDSAVVNDGLISADFNGGTLDISSISGFTNNGDAEAINGGRLTIAATNWTNGAAGTIRSIGADSITTLNGSWSNAGTLEVTDGTLNLGGTFTNTGTGLSGLNRTGGTVNITGNLVNTGQALALNNGTGVIVLNGGAITGGSVTVAGSGSLMFSGSNNNALDGVSVQGGGDFTGASARVRLRNGASFTGDVTLTGSSSILAFEQTSTLAAGRDVFFDAANASGKFVSVEANNTLTIANGASIRGRSGTIRGGFFVGGNSSVVNEGLISSDFNGSTLSISSIEGFTNNGVTEAINGGQLTISPTSWTNGAAGTIRVNGASSVATLNGSWSNAGTLEVTDGVMNLGGTLTNTGSGLSNLNRSGGTVNITGNFVNTGQTLALNNGTGAIVLNGGGITGGSVTVAGSGSLMFSTSGNNFLDGVSVQGGGDFTGANSRVRLRNGAAFTGDVTLTGSGSLLAFEQTSTLATGRDIFFDAANASGKTVSVEGNNTLTIGNGASIRGRAGTIRGGVFVGGTAAVVNDGLISSDFNGATLSISSIEGFTNNGTTEAINGGQLTISATNWTNGATGTIRAIGADSVATLNGSWSNTGTLRVTDGTLNLGGTFTNTGTGLSNLNRTGGTVNITGNLVNTGQTLALNNGTGAIILNGGVITGGAVTVAGSGALVFSASGNNALDGVSVQGGGDFTGASARVRLRNGASFTGDVTLTGSNSLLAFEQTSTLAAGRDIFFDAAITAGKTVSVEGNNTLTIANGASIRGRAGTIRGGVFVGGTAAVVNNGLISSDFNGSTLSISSIEGFTNNGTAEAINGGQLTISATNWTNGAAGTIRAIGASSVATLNGSWSNTGELRVTDGTLNLGGTFTNTGTGLDDLIRNGGTVNITGNLVNTGQALALNNGTGVINLSGGTITGGSVTAAGSGVLAFSGTGGVLDGVSVQGGGDFTGASARVRLRNGSAFTGDVTLTGANSILAFEQTSTLAVGRDIFFDTAIASGKTVSVEANNTLTIASGASIRGRAGTIRGGVFVGGDSAVVNNGLILAEGGGTLAINTLSAFTNNGTLAASTGATLEVNLGTAYALTGDVQARAGGTVRFANGISSINGDIDLELGGALVANYGRLNITGAASVINGSDLDILLVNGFTPDWGDAFNILSYGTNIVTGDFSTLDLPTLTDAVNLRWFTTVTTTAVTIGVRHTSDINRDNQINFADLNIIVSNFNSNGSAAMGDVDEDGFIGFADLNRVLSFFNTSAPVNSVPAPAGAALAAIAGLAGLRRRR